MSKDNILTTLAQLAARHRLVPFLGAGCSIGHTRLDWGALCRTMADQLSISSAGLDHPAVAQTYEDAKSRDALCDLLKSHLFIEQFDDGKGIADVAVLGLGIGLVYTTNQDNVFEECARKYGRPFTRVIELDNLADANSGDCLLVKYHGSPEIPDSIVLTSRDYQRRLADRDHFLNVRLRSDLLAKHFLFLGYSLSQSDTDITRMLEELKSAFSGRIPQSWLVAYEYSPELETRVSSYGVTVIDPRREIPEARTADEAFSAFLCRLGSDTLKFKVQQEVNDIFRPRVPTAARVVSPFELEALSKQIPNLQLPQAFKLFRGLMDRSVIPEHRQDQAMAIFESLAARCRTAEDVMELDATAVNLRFRSLPHTIEMLAILFAATVHDTRGYTDSFLFAASRHSGKPYLPLAIARGVDRLSSSGTKVTDSFRFHSAAWLHDADKLPDDVRIYVKSRVDQAWQGSSKISNPFSASTVRSAFRLRTYDEILNQMLSQIPRQFSKPYEE